MKHYISSCFLISCILLITTSTFGQGQLTKRLIRARRDIRVRNVYFIHMRNSVSTDRIHSYVKELEEMNEDSIPGYHMTVHGIVIEAAFGFSAELSNVALKIILDNKIEVESVEEDHYMKAGELPDKIVSTWGVDRLDKSTNQYDTMYTPPCNLTGEGSDVYVLDSGLLYSHQEFSGRAVYPGCDPIDTLKGSNRSGLDCTGHGSHVAGTIGGNMFGVAPGSTLFSVRVLDCSNIGTVNSVVLGIDCVLKKYKERKRPAVVNLSIYGEKNLLVKRAIDTLLRVGISVVSIAGNNENKPRDSCKIAPGSIQGVITVSASTRSDEAFINSNAGVCVDLFAPGSDIQSATHICDTCETTRAGSSTAAPHVTGAISLMLQKCPSMSPWMVRYTLLSQMVLPNKLDFSTLPSRFRLNTPNLLLHTSSLQCDMQCN